MRSYGIVLLDLHGPRAVPASWWSPQRGQNGQTEEKCVLPAFHPVRHVRRLVCHRREVSAGWLGRQLRRMPPFKEARTAGRLCCGGRRQRATSLMSQPISYQPRPTCGYHHVRLLPQPPSSTQSGRRAQPTHTPAHTT
jgi:hypothetical protein